MKEKAIIFARVSSKEQEETGYSLDSQVKLLTEYADSKGFDVLKIYKVSESASGKQTRKIFGEMLDCVEKNNVLNILCEKIDRLTRNLKDAGIVNDWVAQDKDNKVHFVKDNFIVSRDSRAHENLVWDMKVSIARFYTNNLSEEVRKGQKEKISQGWLPKRAPLGYVSQGDKGHKTHIIDPEKASYVRRMYELYVLGNYSTLELTRIMYKEGLRNHQGRKIGKSRIYDFLTDPFYYGDMRWNGIIYKGKHEPIISKALFDEVQLKLNRKLKVPQFKKHNPVFKAKLSCGGCGGTVTWETQKGHWYGHCNHYKKCLEDKWVRQEAVEFDLFPYLDNIVPKNKRVFEWLEKALKEGHEDEVVDYGKKREEINRLIMRNDKRIEMAYIDKLDGVMESGMAIKIIEDSKTEKEKLEASLEKLSERRHNYYEAGYAIHELASKAKEIYLSPKATIEEKRMLLSYAFSNITLKGGKAKPTYTFAFEFLAEWIPKLNCTFEPQKGGSKKGKESTFVLSHPVLLSQTVTNFESSFWLFKQARYLNDNLGTQTELHHVWRKEDCHRVLAFEVKLRDALNGIDDALEDLVELAFA